MLSVGSQPKRQIGESKMLAKLGLKHNEDALHISIFTLTFIADLLVITFYEPTLVWSLLLLPIAFVLLYCKGHSGAFNHHYQHSEAFDNMTMNHALHSMLAMHTFVPYGHWVYQHNLDHHANTIPAAPFPHDAAGWMNKDGSQMSHGEFVLKIGLYAHYAVFKNLFKMKGYYKRYAFHTLFATFLFATFLSAGFYLNPIPTFVLWFVLPLIVFFSTVSETYIHHAGLYENESQPKGARNEISPVYNFCSGNLGYHSAHHEVCNMHWTEYPEIHMSLHEDGEILDEPHRYHVKKPTWFYRLLIKYFYDNEKEMNLRRDAAFSIHSNEIKELYKDQMK